MVVVCKVDDYRAGKVQKGVLIRHDKVQKGTWIRHGKVQYMVDIDDGADV